MSGGADAVEPRPPADPPAPRLYRVFGGRLASEVELPGLPEAEPDGSAPDWTLVRAEGPAAGDEGAGPLADDRVKPGVRVRLRRVGDDLRLAFDDTGDFDVSRDGTRIRFRPGPEARPEDLRLDVVGRVLPLALHRQGMTCLHASAVVTGEGAVAFLGPKGAGKTTMALTLSGMGAAVLSDDVVPVEPGDPPRARPGVDRLRIRRDVAEAAGRTGAGDRATDGRVEVEPDVVADGASVPLAALYVLVPVEADDSDHRVRRERMTGPGAALALMGELKLGPLLAPWRGAELLEACASLERGVPVYRLEVPRDVGRLDEPSRFVLEKHGGPVSAGAPAG